MDVDVDLESVRIGSPSLLEVNPPIDPDISASLSKLEETSHVFIRKVQEKRLDGTNGFARFFDILNSQGARIYQGIERTPKDLTMSKGQAVFTVSILDLKEMELFRVIGRFGEKYSVFQRDDQLWGGVQARIHYDNRDIYPISFVKQGTNNTHRANKEETVFNNNANNKSKKLKSNLRKSKEDTYTEILYIVGDKIENNSGCCGSCRMTDTQIGKLSSNTQNFEGRIFLPDRVTCIGRMGVDFSAVDGILCEKDMVAGCFGIQFPAQTDLRIKAILLGAPFFLYPKLFK